jgi:cytoskeletal protein CcmA (bactofilin family)
MSLWQKPDSDQGSTTKTSTGTQPSASPVRDRETRTENRLVNIGQSIKIKGELTGNEDLTIDGNFEGKIMLKDHHLTIGSNGHITAEIKAKSVLIHGEVIGDVNADDKVEISPSGSVNGDLSAPRVLLADGSSFKGAIDMSGSSSGKSSSTSSSTSTSTTTSSMKGEFAGSASGSKV